MKKNPPRQKKKKKTDDFNISVWKKKKINDWGDFIGE